MKEPYIEGVATHDGPESCVGARKGVGEALTGVRVGRAIEPRKGPHPGCRRRQDRRKATPPPAPARAVGGPRAVEEPVHARNLHAREPGDPAIARPRWRGGPQGKGQGRKPLMHDCGKSDGPVVPAKLPNNAASAAAEAVEGRGPAKGNATGKTRPGHRAGQGTSNALDRVRRPPKALARRAWTFGPRGAQGVSSGGDRGGGGHEPHGPSRPLEEGSPGGHRSARLGRRRFL